MFDWLKRKTPAPALVPLYFKNSAAAFEYACEFLQTELKAGVHIPALVQDASEVLGVGSQVKRQPDGNQTALLTISSSDGGFTVAAATSGPTGPKLKVGDLVVWMAGEPITHLQDKYTDSRMTWAGLIVAKLRPEYTVGRGWAIEQPFK